MLFKDIVKKMKSYRLGKKHLQISYLIKVLSPQLIKDSQKSLRRKNNLKKKRRKVFYLFGEHTFHQKRYTDDK